jgi:hypothetical protein
MISPGTDSVSEMSLIVIFVNSYPTMNTRSSYRRHVALLPIYVSEQKPTRKRKEVSETPDIEQVLEHLRSAQRVTWRSAVSRR